MTAVFGITAHNAEDFLEHGFVCLDKTNPQESGVFQTFRTIRAEDIIFIKDYSPQSGLQIKAVGVATLDYTPELDSGVCIPVVWVWKGEKSIEEFDEKCSQCGAPFYEEHNITVQKTIMDLMPSELMLPQEW